MKRLLPVLIFVVVAGAAYFYFSKQPAQAPVQDGNPNNLPVTASTSGGQYINAKEGDVVVDTPKALAVVGKKFEVTGSAKGWYFEASFPIEVRDANNAVIGQGIAQAQGDWMTASPVPFKASVTITGAYTGPGVLVLKKDNPSGDPAKDAAYIMPIVIQ